MVVAGFSNIGAIMEAPNGAPAQHTPVFEIVIRWVPSTKQIQFAASNGLDKVAILGLLEMAKASLAAPQQEQAPLIVPGRFAS